MQKGTVVMAIRVPLPLVEWVDEQAEHVHRSRNGFIWNLLEEEKARQEAGEPIHASAE